MNSDMALKGMISRASIIMQEAEYLSEILAWNMVVRRSQESMELALKCALLWAGIEVPRIHDVGPILNQYGGRYPEPFKIQIPHFASISRVLRAEVQGSVLVINNVRALICDVCDEAYITPDASREIEKIVRDVRDGKIPAKPIAATEIDLKMKESA